MTRPRRRRRGRVLGMRPGPSSDARLRAATGNLQGVHWRRESLEPSGEVWGFLWSSLVLFDGDMRTVKIDVGSAFVLFENRIWSRTSDIFGFDLFEIVSRDLEVGFNWFC